MLKIPTSVNSRPKPPSRLSRIIRCLGFATCSPTRSVPGRIRPTSTRGPIDSAAAFRLCGVTDAPSRSRITIASSARHAHRVGLRQHVHLRPHSHGGATVTKARNNPDDAHLAWRFPFRTQSVPDGVTVKVTRRTRRIHHGGELTGGAVRIDEQPPRDGTHAERFEKARQYRPLRTFDDGAGHRFRLPCMWRRRSTRGGR